LEAFSHNLTDDSLGSFPAQASANTNYSNECSRSLLVGEQLNAYWILLQYDRKNRHQRIKEQ
ncbi:MAG: hypothetical protein J3R72DRAFT_356657, partial [Linnemannia gamsii]